MLLRRGSARHASPPSTAGALQALSTAGARTVLMASEALSVATEACSVDVTRPEMRMTKLAPTMPLTTDADITALLSAISARGPDVVILCSLFAMTERVIAAAKAANVNARAWLSLNSLSDPRFVTSPALRASPLIDSASWFPVATDYANLYPEDATCLRWSPV